MLGNAPDAIRAFTKTQQGGTVYKAIMHKTISDDGTVKLIYTSPVGDADTIDERVTLTMHQFQANLAHAKLFDARLIATRKGHTAIAIRTDDPDARQDFRVRYDALTYDLVDVPAKVAAGCLRYMLALDLHLGVFDFSVTEQGWYFLESGPGAQWAWLQEATGAPIAALIAAALLGEPL
jgi:hypothetical protein